MAAVDFCISKVTWEITTHRPIFTSAGSPTVMTTIISVNSPEIKVPPSKRSTVTKTENTYGLWLRREAKRVSDSKTKYAGVRN